MAVSFMHPAPGGQRSSAVGRSGRTAGGPVELTPEEDCELQKQQLLEGNALSGLLLELQRAWQVHPLNRLPSRLMVSPRGGAQGSGDCWVTFGSQMIVNVIQDLISAVSLPWPTAVR